MGEIDYGRRGILTVKYGTDGSLIWSDVYDASSDVDSPQAMALDPSGSVYITGHTYQYSDSHYTTLRHDVVTIKYDSQGNLAWEVFYDGPFIGFFDDGKDGPVELALNDSGDIYVTGWSEFRGDRI